MIYDASKVITVVTADSIPNRIITQGLYGYFAHDIDSLRKAVESDKTSHRCMYGRLTKITEATNRARFVLDRGDYVYSLFYPTDTFLNVNRY